MSTVTATNGSPALLQPQLDAITKGSGPFLSSRLTPAELTILNKQFETYNNPFPVPAVGSQAPDFTLPDHTGRQVSLKQVVASGRHAILVWYRGEWCPFCQKTLRALNEQVDAYGSHNADVFAITGTLPSLTPTTVQNWGLRFPILSDVGNVVARQYGTVYQLDEDLSRIQTKLGVDWKANYGDDTHELPHAGFFIVERGSGRLAYAHVNPDFKVRPEPTELINVLKTLQ